MSMTDNGYPSYEEALDEYDRALGWSPEEEREPLCPVCLEDDCEGFCF